MRRFKSTFAEEREKIIAIVVVSFLILVIPVVIFCLVVVAFYDVVYFNKFLSSQFLNDGIIAFTLLGVFAVLFRILILLLKWLKK